MSRRKEKPDVFEMSWWVITGSYVLYFLIALALFGVLSVFWGQYVLFSIEDLWLNNPDILAGISKVWFLFAWGIVATLIIGILVRKASRTNDPGLIFGKGIWLSINAGFFEELIYRWLRFSVAMIVLPFLNLITFGLVKWVYEFILIPIANWVTVGALSEFLFHPASWVIGAAIISANGSFRDAHKANGLINAVNSWFIGMVFFYLMFNFGLVTAIVAHVLYDICVFTTMAITMSWRPAYSINPWTQMRHKRYLKTE